MIYEKIKFLASNNKNITYASIAECILNSVLNEKRMSIIELAKKSNVTISSVNRFCKEIGLDGYKDLYSNLKLESNFIKPLNYLSFEIKGQINRNYDDLKEHLNTVISSVSNIFDYSLEIINIANNLKRYSMLYLYGAGESAVLLALWKKMLRFIDITVIFDQDSDEQLFYAKNHRNKAAHVFLSFSGTSPSIIECINSIKSDLDGYSVLFTGNANASAIGEVCDAFILKNSEIKMLDRYSSELSIIFIFQQILILLSN